MLMMAFAGWIMSGKVAAQSIDSTLFNQLHFRFIGPDGNRAIAVAGVPGDRNISYVGAASGVSS